VPAVNLGTHAGLGADYLLYRARQILRPGDTALLALEYNLGAGWGVGLQLASLVMTSDPAYLLHAPAQDLTRLVFGYSPFDIAKLAPGATVPLGVYYNPESVDAFGDETVNIPANKLPGMLPAVKSAGPLYPLADLRDGIAEFFAWAQANDVRVLRVWAPAVYHPEYEKEGFRAMFAATVDAYARRGIPTVGDFIDYMLPADMMFDTMHHADSNGRKLVSEQLARDLCAGAISCAAGAAATVSRR
jgi:hypothetical protein